jgi:two-component system, NarL family, invasion response regulator UvrY
MYSILLAEDHSIVRIGARVLIEEMLSGVVIAEAESFDEAIKKLNRESRFDLLLLDIHLPGGDSISMIGAIKMRQPDLAILIFSAYEEQVFALNYIKAGARGFLPKRSSPAEMRAAIKKVLEGGTYLSPSLQEALLAEKLYPSRNTQTPLDGLSQREREVARMLLKGASSKEIRYELNIEYSTISTHKKRIFEKLKVANVLELSQKLRALDQLQKENGGVKQRVQNQWG